VKLEPNVPIMIFRGFCVTTSAFCYFINRGIQKQNFKKAYIIYQNIFMFTIINITYHVTVMCSIVKTW